MTEYIESLRTEIADLRKERDEALAAVGKAVKSNCDEALLQQLNAARKEVILVNDFRERLRSKCNTKSEALSEVLACVELLQSQLSESRAREAVMRDALAAIQSDAAADAGARGVVEGLRMAAVIIDRKLPQIQG